MILRTYLPQIDEATKQQAFTVILALGLGVLNGLCFLGPTQVSMV